MPSQITVSVTANPNDSKGQLKKGWTGEPVQRKGEFTVSIGENAAEDIKIFGDTLVHNRFAAQVTIDAAGVARGMLEDNKSPAEIQAFLNTWKPGTSAPRVAKVVDLKSMTPEQIKGIDFTAMSLENVEVLRAKLQEALKAKKG